MVYQALDYGIPGHGDLIRRNAGRGNPVLHIGEVWRGNSKKCHSFDYSLFPGTVANNPFMEKLIVSKFQHHCICLIV